MCSGLEHGVQTWSSSPWRDLAISWLDEQLAAAGNERTGEVEQPHLRPWATVLRAPTTSGPVWLKAAGPGTAFEVGLYELLHRVAPERVLAPIAVDTTRGWVLLPDGGPPLADRLTGTDLADAMVTILPLYGRLQRDLAPHADELLALGVADMRPTIMPNRFDEALVAAAEYVERTGEASDREILVRAAALRDTFASWCDRLAAAPGSPSLDHNDLHPWNILVADTSRLDRARFYDWGDGVVAHPFASMLVPLAWVQRKLEIDLDHPDVLRVRDAYLDVFSDLAPRAELVDGLELACRVGKAARALTWARAVRALGDDAPEEFARAPLESVASLLDDSYLGRT